MIKLLTEQNFTFAVSVLLPGFMLLANFMMAFRTRLPPIFFIVLLSVVLSFFYNNTLYLLQDSFSWLAKPAPKPLADLVNFVLVPSVLGYVGGELWERTAPKLRERGIPIRSPIPTAWDYAFAKRSLCWVLVRFKDNRDAVRGIYNKAGFAGTDLDHMDLYLERICERRVGDRPDGTHGEGWFPVEPPLAIWIAGSEIHSIEFDIGATVGGQQNDGQEKTSEGRLSGPTRWWTRKGRSSGKLEGKCPQDAAERPQIDPTD